MLKITQKEKLNKCPGSFPFETIAKYSMLKICPIYVHYTELAVNWNGCRCLKLQSHVNVTCCKQSSRTSYGRTLQNLPS